MLGWGESLLLFAGLAFVGLAIFPTLKRHRSLFAGTSAFLFVTALSSRPGNPLSDLISKVAPTQSALAFELLGCAWWILSAWVFTRLLNLVLRRIFFPSNHEPHARRLFADLASALIYSLSFIAIMTSVFDEPVSTFLATSGIVAIVLGLALQNTLGDVLAGLAINIERPFRAGDWITLSNNVSGQVMQVNWRATRLRTTSNDMIVVPNSVATKDVVTNHSYPRDPHRLTIQLQVDCAISPEQVIEALKSAAVNTSSLKETFPEVHLRELKEGLIVYDLSFAVVSFATAPRVRSDVLQSVVKTFLAAGVRIGAPAMDVRLVGSDRISGEAVD